MIARVRGGVVSQIHPKGMALGLGQKGVFGEETSDLVSNDIFIFFTDGVSEAMNDAKEEFGTDRVFADVERIIADAGNRLLPEHIYTALMRSVEKFTTKQCFDDDATLVIVQVC
jgi:sigma-B regulation protein RsbU (phosphoserine phosphatase)